MKYNLLPMSTNSSPNSVEVGSSKTSQTLKQVTPRSMVAGYIEDDEISRENESTFLVAEFVRKHEDEKKESSSAVNLLSGYEVNEKHMKLARDAVKQYTLLQSTKLEENATKPKNRPKSKTNNSYSTMNESSSSRSSDRIYQDPTYFDVLCGRSKLAFEHPGNHIFRAHIAKFMDEYTECKTRNGKTSIILNVISSVLNNGGNFLKYDREKEMWYDGGLQTAKIRVSTAFRDAGIPNKNKSIERLRKECF
mmetsp:Transcript_16938/g.25628  ORF Transcript_16938/g.25628 Transcript_16938/m.25628 type:complete len:250 (-) Transcript_16938:305-1054(-)